MANEANLKPWGPNNPPPLSPGRPRKRPQSEANDDLLRMEIPESMLRQLNTVMQNGRAVQMQILKAGATWADAIAYGLAKKAVMGDATAAKELRESVEGKSVQRVELTSPEDKGFEVKVTFELPAAQRQVEKTVANKILEATVISTDPDETKD